MIHQNLHLYAINEARTVLVLLAAGKTEEAARIVKSAELEFTESGAARLDVDVQALWDQVRIACGNPSDRKYFEQVKDELNRISFEFISKTE